MVTIPVILAADNNYAPYMYTTAYSIVKNSCSDIFLDFYILIPDNFLDIHKQNFIQLENQYNICKFNFINMQKAFSSVKRTIKHISYNAYYRLKAAEVIPLKYDKCLYFDCDVIVNTDLLELFNTQLNDYYVAGVKAVGYFFSEFNAQKYCEQIGIPNIQQYINSGVLLFNLQKIREDNITELWIEEALKNKLPGDQDVINKICFDHIKHIPYKYNVCAIRLYEKDELLRKALSQTEINEARQSPLIIHYANEEKPWQNPNLALAKYWWKYAQNTPYKHNIIKTRIMYFFKRNFFFIRKDTTHKFITILGIKIKLKRKKTLKNIVMGG